jgi:hypothetical protein
MVIKMLHDRFFTQFSDFFVTMALEMLGLYLSNVIVENSFCNIQT